MPSSTWQAAPPQPPGHHPPVSLGLVNSMHWRMLRNIQASTHHVGTASTNVGDQTAIQVPTTPPDELPSDHSSKADLHQDHGFKNQTSSLDSPILLSLFFLNSELRCNNSGLATVKQVQSGKDRACWCNRFRQGLNIMGQVRIWEVRGPMVLSPCWTFLWPWTEGPDEWEPWLSPNQAGTIGRLVMILQRRCSYISTSLFTYWLGAMWLQKREWLEMPTAAPSLTCPWFSRWMDLGFRGGPCHLDALWCPCLYCWAPMAPSLHSWNSVKLKRVTRGPRLLFVDSSSHMTSV